MLLRIVEKENGEILVLYNDGRYGKASISTLREIFEGIETIEDMVGETDGWELDYTEMEDYPGKTRAYRSLRGYGHLKNVQVGYFHALLENTGNGGRSEPLRPPLFYALSLSTRISFMLTPHSRETA